MIVFNGKKFARDDKEITSSLFAADGTCAGFYRQTSDGVQLLDLQKTVFAFIKFDRSDSFLVTAFPADNGRTRYMFSTTDDTDRALGVQDAGFMAVRDLCADVRRQLTVGV